jgi:hypothetical protein
MGGHVCRGCSRVGWGPLATGSSLTFNVTLRLLCNSLPSRDSCILILTVVRVLYASVVFLGTFAHFPT